MTYSELSDICYLRKISLTSVAESAGMTLRGFRDGVNNRTLGIKALEAVCRTLEISPNDFLGWREEVSSYKTNMIGENHHNSIGSAGIDILQQQLSVKDNQIKELMELLKKNT